MPAELIHEGSQLTIFEILGSGDKERIESLLALYSQLFPKYAHYVNRMQRRSSAPPDAREGHIAHYWLIEYERQPIGMATFRYIHKRNCGAGIAFGIVPETRSIRVKDERLSKYVISIILRQLAEDCEKLSSSDYWGLITEVEHPELMGHYKRMGMYELPIKYYEPIFPSENGKLPRDELDLIKFIPVILGITPNPKVPFQNYDSEILCDFAAAFLIDHYGLPENHEIVRSVLESIYDS